VTWIAPAYLRPDERQDHGVSYYLHSGASGIALFLAALARVTAESTYRETARAACLPMTAVLESDRTEGLLRHEGIGACHGLGGIVYALACIGRLLDDPFFIDLGLRVAQLITPERIAADTALDVEGGAAGATLGILALHEEVGADWILERAVACGQHLVDASRPAPAGGRAWPGHEGLMLAGFAHGAAGISHALIRLFRSSREAVFLDAAKEGFAFERGVFCPETRNWPLLQYAEGATEPRAIDMKAWCHGAPGVALSRACGLDLVDDADTRGDLDVALEATMGVGLGGLDHLCCGNLGRVDAVLTAGQILDHRGLVREAGGRAAMVVRRATTRGAYGLRLDESENRCFLPGFFQGISGIGYQLLRLAEPSLLPSVLAFLPVRSREVA
jgi:lantibiotic modifying enzyme